ncbi:MAG TPA: hypothetical protein VKZ71_00240 [Burkholderiaceae bacterium]|nr:hypothetical protein [Burkholderiaceae bacterium]
MLKHKGSGAQPREGSPRHRYQGSALLYSSIQRVARVLVVVALMWLMAGWAMDWWLVS